MVSHIAKIVNTVDIDMAIASHENWKYRLQAFLDGRSTEKFVAEEICFDDRCDLGKWIHGAGKAKLGNFPGFTALQGHHKMFHYAASNVVALAQAGKTEEANKMLDVQFTQQSAEVVRDLRMLKALAEEAADE
ncbi:CZB domain-containing protein [Comamonas kerstersii]|nr:CZB domain-containing protein [Comamonas kerstersii]